MALPQHQPEIDLRAQNTYQFDPVDIEHLRLMGRLGAGKRVLAMVDAHELVCGLIRGRLRRRYPDLSTAEMGQMLLKELARDDTANR